jgi:hypothetical protein
MTQDQRLSARARVVEVFRDLWARGERSARVAVSDVATQADVSPRQARALLRGLGFTLDGGHVDWTAEG